MAGACVAAGTAPAGAHVDVLPRSVPQGEAVELTVRVPSERRSPTVGVEVAFPPQVTVFSLGEPPAGWRAQPRRAPDGRLSGVRYAGGRIAAGRYADFPVLATPFESGTAVFPTRQTHADGEVSRWTGPPAAPDNEEAPEPAPDAPGPAPALEIVAEGGGGGAASSGGGVEGAAQEDSGAAIWLGVIAIAIAAGAALLAGFLWSTRPARLPEDDEGEDRA